MILVTGATGFLGRAVGRALDAAQVAWKGLPRRHMLDLRYAGGIQALLPWHPGATVIHLAYPGTAGIATMLDQPASLVHDMLQIDLNVIDACAKAKVARLVCVGSVCEYPQDVTFPTQEAELWKGYPEETNAPYGIAKRMQGELLKVYARQYGLQSAHLILGNLYGPGDRSGHVIPATIRKVLHARAAGDEEIVVWGDGTATREFLYVEDAARAVVAAATRPYVPPAPMNVCSGEEVPIRELVYTVCDLLDWHGAVTWDPTKPNGQPRRYFSRNRAYAELGWLPTVDFQAGLRRTVETWLLQDPQP